MGPRARTRRPQSLVRIETAGRPLPPVTMTRDADSALHALLALLEKRGYSFVTVTPATHARVVARRQTGGDLRDLLGWSLPVPTGTDMAVEDLLRAAGMLDETDGRARSRLRVSSLGGRLFLHSAYPTEAEDSVFFGPDSHRFARLIAAELARSPAKPSAHIVDIGAGAGVGGLAAAGLVGAPKVTLTDINPKALRLARINAAAAGIDVRTIEASDLDAVDDPIDLALANPPYIMDADNRAYRDGGGLGGGQLSVDMAQMALQRLAPDGRLILYTGAAIVAGRNPVGKALTGLADRFGRVLRCEELDPDVFGEELDSPAYADVERIAALAAVFEPR